MINNNIAGKYEALKAEKEASVAPDMQTEIEELKLQCSKLKVHFLLLVLPLDAGSYTSLANETLCCRKSMIRFMILLTECLKIRTKRFQGFCTTTINFNAL